MRASNNILLRALATLCLVFVLVPKELTAGDRSGATAHAPREELLTSLDWSWLAAGTTAFFGSVAVLSAVDARALERDLEAAIDSAKTSPMPSSQMVALVERTERRAAMTNVFWAATGVSVVATFALVFMERQCPIDMASPVPLSTGGSRAQGTTGSQDRDWIPSVGAINRSIDGGPVFTLTWRIQ